MFGRVVGCALVLAMAGCGFSEGPTNANIAKSGGPTVDRAEQVVRDNARTVWPVAVRSFAVVRSGCRNNQSMMGYGPPWVLTLEQSLVDPPQDFVDSALAKLESMTERGFVREPDWSQIDDPANRSYTDGRGYRLTAYLDTAGPRTFRIASVSPCATQ
ncbi:hypothetical protein ACLMAJ_09955 [Nocardia sp. KC 131]|uniref:hypothetical protein n=1 Tax=Nocardia arseniciresistens TaxID=3392119 RepID=UPI00398F7B07